MQLFSPLYLLCSFLKSLSSAPRMKTDIDVDLKFLVAIQVEKVFAMVGTKAVDSA